MSNIAQAFLKEKLMEYDKHKLGKKQRDNEARFGCILQEQIYTFKFFGEKHAHYFQF